MKPLAIRSILVATDLETDSASALGSIFELADLAGADVHIVHAGLAPAGDDRIGAKVAELRKVLGREVDVSVLGGPAAAAITQEAARTKADVIVLGHHRNLAGAPGSTAYRVIRTARIPCLILPQHLSLPLSTVLVPVDINQVAGPLDVALTWASALRRRKTDGTEPTRVEVLYVDGGVSADVLDVQRRLQDEVSATRKRVSQIASVQINEHVARESDVPSAILNHAESVDAALLVLGTRAERIESDPLGSVSSAVAMRATRPALLVPPELWQASDYQVG